ncbi:FZO-like [Tripterygium wilfordii]|uniref:FZO-like n=1 Tax=Tripterygium wilfordii TaxID=458696 RepID=A0A7J7DD66_TRIWF|nr:probable transmembrane GTPase FZO-like, chloroplastic [Tripterygium wilfordii]KAF5744198.1 FZO-like [Tripterygium wilfordii]
MTRSLSLHASLSTPYLFLAPSVTLQPPPSFIRFKSTPHRTHCPIKSLPNSSNQDFPSPLSHRTLFPGGYKRPEIKVPSLVLQLNPDEVLKGEFGDEEVLGLVDAAVSQRVGIVILNGGQGGGGRSLYQAACLLKSVVRDRAYLLISERVDIAAAVNASGVVLSDQGLPAIVARNMMMDSKSDSVVLPLVGRKVQTANAALNASNSEGADFLLYSFGEEQGVLFDNVKIPIFIGCDAPGGDATSLLAEALKAVKPAASGLVISLDDLRLLSDNVLDELLNAAYSVNTIPKNEPGHFSKLKSLNVDGDVRGGKRLLGFVKLEDREKLLIERERMVLLEAIDVIKKTAPLMEEVSLLIDVVSQIAEPFLLAIVGEFNSGKSTVINALLGKRYLQDGVVPTTNEITFLCYSEVASEGQQRCERHPDGQYICYLPAPILKEMKIVDTPGTNVILQRQQRLTEEFIPRADLLLFVISADRPLTESEVAFLRYIQQWKKKVVFVLNKSDLYQNARELKEAMSFIKDNTKKLLNTENVILYPVSARSALEAKLSKGHGEISVSDSLWRTSRFHELEKFLYSFLDGSTTMGMERMKLKLATPIGIAGRLFSACETLVRQDCQYAMEDLTSANEIVGSVKQYVMKMENESISWRRQALSLIYSTKSRVVELIESTLQLSNLDLVTSYIFKGDKSAMLPATSRIKNDIIGPALSDGRKLVGEYVLWLQTNNAREGRLYKESFENRWPSFVHPSTAMHLETYELLKKVDELSLRVIDKLSALAASKLFDQNIRDVFSGTFGGLGAAGLSASLLTSVLPTTLEDLLALGLCSAGGYIAISSFPVRRQVMIDRVNKLADALACELEEAMQKDLLEASGNLEKFVSAVGKPYQEEAQDRLNKLLAMQDELSNAEKKLRTLEVEIQNLHI